MNHEPEHLPVAPRATSATSDCCAAPEPPPETAHDCCAPAAPDPAHGHAHGRNPADIPVILGAVYTCPMHPQIRKEGPGTCTICGMALEPEMPSLEDGPSAEERDMRRRFWLALFFTLPLFALEMGAHALGLHLPLTPAQSGWLQAALATPVVFIAGWPLLVRGAQSVKSRHLNMFTLIALGVAYVASLAALVAPGLVPTAFLAANGRPPLYFEAAAVITALVLLGQWLEIRAREKTGGALRALLDLTPKTARRVKPDGSEETLALDQVRVGHSLKVLTGETIPVDGFVTTGEASLDESLLTGESMPIVKTKGAGVTGGTLVTQGSLVMRAGKVGRDTMLAQLSGLSPPHSAARRRLRAWPTRSPPGSCPPCCLRRSRPSSPGPPSRPRPPWRRRSRRRSPSSSSPARARSVWRRRCRSWSRWGAARRPAFCSATRKRSKRSRACGQSRSTRPAR
jgi:hypothetical protein